MLLNQFLEGLDLQGNLFFTLTALQSSGRRRRMVKFRETKDLASHSVSRMSVETGVNVAQWQAWLRHARDEAPSVDELLQDERRREKVRLLGKIADEKWRKDVKKLPVQSTHDTITTGILSMIVVIVGIKETEPEPWSTKITNRN